jgi:hypothetical protein
MMTVENVSSHHSGGEMKTENESLDYIYTGDIDLDEFREIVAERAYCKAEKRGFEPGHEMDDWLEAEREISNQFRYWSLG